MKYKISIVENGHGMKYFELTDFHNVIKNSSLKECLLYFGLNTSEESLKEWGELAYQNDNSKN
jgi:hypothetical protein